MTTFAYVATDVNGKKVKGTEMAEDSVELIDKLRQKGLFCTSYKDASKNKAADVSIAASCRQKNDRSFVLNLNLTSAALFFDASL